MTRVVAIFMLSALLGNGLALAQTQREKPSSRTEAAQPDSEPNAASQTVAGSEENTDTMESAESTETAEPPQRSAAEQTAAQGDSSPFDYEASEQISEDLSVSFPIDI